MLLKLNRLVGDRNIFSNIHYMKRRRVMATRLHFFVTAGYLFRRYIRGVYEKVGFLS